MLTTKTAFALVLREEIEVTCAATQEGSTAPAPQLYHLFLQALGRTPNGKKIAVE